MWLTARPGQTSWMRTLVAPFRADVGRGPVVGLTVSSVAERTVVHAVGPGVSSRPRRLSAVRNFERAACCHAAGVHPSLRQAARLPAVVPCWLPAAAITSGTFARRLGQYVSAIRGSSPPWLMPKTATGRPARADIV